MSALPNTIYLSFFCALLALIVGRRSASLARGIALATAVAGWGVVLAAAVSFTPTAGLQNLVDIPWIPTMGIHYHLAADGISLTLLVLTGLAATAGVLFSWNITERTGEFFAFYLALIGGVYGVFLSADAMLLFVFYEIAIIPKYFLIANWGSTNREYGAMKLAIYSFAGSAPVLGGAALAHACSARRVFPWVILRPPRLTSRVPEQIGLFALSFFCLLCWPACFLSYLGSGWPRGCSDRCVDVARRCGHEARRVRLSARRHAAFPAGFPFFKRRSPGWP